MKILLLGNGSGVHTIKWIKGLKLTLQDCEIYLLNLNPMGVWADIENEIGKDHIFNLAPKAISEAGENFSYLTKIPQLRRLIRSLKPDVVTTIYLTSYGFLGAICKGRSKLCHFVIGSDILVTPKKSWLHFLVAKWSLSRADLVMSVSATVAKDVVEKFNYPAEKLLVQHYGLESWLLELVRPPAKYTFISNRAWVANSNIDSIAACLSKFPQERSAFVGSPAIGYEKLGEKIAVALGLLEGAEIFPNLHYNKNINLVAQSKFLLSWTFTDGTPSSVIEAMAVGTIPIVSDTGPNREWVDDGVNGVLIPLDDPEKTYVKIKEALSFSQDKIADMVKRNKEIIERRASLKTNMGKLSARLEQLF